jgi:hypothetical protein
MHQRLECYLYIVTVSTSPKHTHLGVRRPPAGIYVFLLPVPEHPSDRLFRRSHMDSSLCCVSYKLRTAETKICAETWVPCIAWPNRRRMLFRM